MTSQIYISFGIDALIPNHEGYCLLECIGIVRDEQWQSENFEAKGRCWGGVYLDVDGSRIAEKGIHAPGGKKNRPTFHPSKGRIG